MGERDRALLACLAWSEGAAAAGGEPGAVEVIGLARGLVVTRGASDAVRYLLAYHPVQFLGWLDAWARAGLPFPRL